MNFNYNLKTNTITNSLDVPIKKNVNDFINCLKTITGKYQTQGFEVEINDSEYESDYGISPVSSLTLNLSKKLSDSEAQEVVLTLKNKFNQQKTDLLTKTRQELAHKLNQTTIEETLKCWEEKIIRLESDAQKILAKYTDPKHAGVVSAFKGVANAKTHLQTYKEEIAKLQQQPEPTDDEIIASSYWLNKGFDEWAENHNQIDYTVN